MLAKLTSVQEEVRNSAQVLSQTLSPNAPAREILSHYRRATGSAPPV